MPFSQFYEEPDNEGDRLSKIRFLLNHLNNTVTDIYTPHIKLSLDESMVFLRRRLVFRQYIKKKKHKFDVTFFELCTNEGFVLIVGVYSGVKFANM